MLAVSPAPVAALPAASPALRIGFVLLSLVVASLVPLAVHRAGIRAGLDPARVRGQTVRAIGATVAWLALTLGAAGAGLLRFSPTPPTMGLVFIGTFAIAFGVSFSAFGRRIATQLPVAALVGFQAFRIAVELLLHEAHVEGLMPVQMSYSGRNFDIVSGVTAVLVAVWLGTRRGRSRGLVLAWNTLGLALLLNILTIALLSSPVPFRVFMNEPSNIWVTQAPWVWLPSVLVLAALTGHLLVYRRVWIDARAGEHGGR